MNVSRETEDMLRVYCDALVKWTKKINLIAPSTVADAWSRHIVDSKSAVEVIKNVRGHWVDLGSGGGLPGLVAAIIHRKDLTGCTLVESDQRKCVFLRSVVRDLQLNVNVLPQRIENMQSIPADVISARALAPLEKLFAMTEAYHASSCRFLFLKGRNWRQEVKEAGDLFTFSLEVFPSVTDTGSATLLISNVKRRTHG